MKPRYIIFYRDGTVHDSESRYKTDHNEGAIYAFSRITGWWYWVENPDDPIEPELIPWVVPSEIRIKALLLT